MLEEVVSSSSIVYKDHHKEGQTGRERTVNTRLIQDNGRVNSLRCKIMTAHMTLVGQVL